jgi:hypothetical protein
MTIPIRMGFTGSWAGQTRPPIVLTVAQLFRQNFEQKVYFGDCSSRVPLPQKTTLSPKIPSNRNQQSKTNYWKRKPLNIRSKSTYWKLHHYALLQLQLV